MVEVSHSTWCSDLYLWLSVSENKTALLGTIILCAFFILLFSAGQERSSPSQASASPSHKDLATGPNVNESATVSSNHELEANNPLFYAQLELGSRDGRVGGMTCLVEYAEVRRME